MRDYPPAHVIHEADCLDAPPGLLAFRVMAVAQAYPNATAHRCISPETVRMNREVVAEPEDSGDHAYEPSTNRPDDAIRPLCRVCRGTHGERVALSEFGGFR